MKRMSPMNSQHRNRERREPTDMQKTARIAIIRNRQRMARLGSAWPNPTGIDDGDISDDFAYDAQGEETWQRPEPNPNYDSEFNPAIKDLERLAIKEETLEEELKALNATIAAKEVSSTLSLQDPDVAEARGLYKELDKTRQELSTIGNRTSSGIREVKRGGAWPAAFGGGAGVALTLIALYAWRRSPRRGGGPRYIGTKDRLSIFGNF
jgi:hypothetical protein